MSILKFILCTLSDMYKTGFQSDNWNFLLLKEPYIIHIFSSIYNLLFYSIVLLTLELKKNYLKTLYFTYIYKSIISFLNL